MTVPATPAELDASTNQIQSILGDDNTQYVQRVLDDSLNGPPGKSYPKDWPKTIKKYGSEVAGLIVNSTAYILWWYDETDDIFKGTGYSGLKADIRDDGHLEGENSLQGMRNVFETPGRLIEKPDDPNSIDAKAAWQQYCEAIENL